MNGRYSSWPMCGSRYRPEPAKAKRLAHRLEIHYTPKHGSWLNMAEIEIAILAGQRLGWDWRPATMPRHNGGQSLSRKGPDRLVKRDAG